MSWPVSRGLTPQSAAEQRDEAISWLVVPKRDVFGAVVRAQPCPFTPVRCLKVLGPPQAPAPRNRAVFGVTLLGLGRAGAWEIMGPAAEL